MTRGGHPDPAHPADPDGALDDALALRSRDGDPAALAALYRRVAPGLLAALGAEVRDRAEAEDVMHESFLRLFRGRGRYDGRGRFRAWIRTVAFRIARDRARRERRWLALRDRATDVAGPVPAPDPSRIASDRDLLHRVESALADLPETYAVTLHLRVRDGLSYREIAEALGEPEGTLRSRVHHALRRVRRALLPTGASRSPRSAQGDES